MLKRWLREPFVHFLLAGALLFAVYTYVRRDDVRDDRVIHISAQEVNWLKEVWVLQWQRDPTHDELRELVTDYLRESLLAREAGELGLDRDDLIVRRRLAQKMEFLIRDTAGLAAPDDASLRKIYDADRAKYRSEPRITFDQIYFRSRIDALEALERIARREPGVTGDVTLLEDAYHDVDRRAVSATFGPGFAQALFDLGAGAWQGPVESGLGYHLVRIAEVVPARDRAFADVRNELVEEWQREQQAEASRKFFDGLLTKYEVVVDPDVQPFVAPLDEEAR